MLHASQNLFPQLLDFRLPAELLKFFHVFLFQPMATLRRLAFDFAAPFVTTAVSGPSSLEEEVLLERFLCFFDFPLLGLLLVFHAHHDLRRLRVLRLALLPIPAPQGF